jgi:hypothetical protein
MKPRTLSEVLKRFHGLPLTDRLMREIGVAVEQLLHRYLQDTSVQAHTPVQVLRLWTDSVNVSFSVKLDSGWVSAKEWDTLLTALYERYPNISILGIRQESDGTWSIRSTTHSPSPFNFVLATEVPT